ncbi:MAG: DedA family protein [Corynebacteriales bacterium]|nr:DedA family protein [Mycobacteriales bacterium]
MLDLIVAIATSPWVYLVLLIMIAVDVVVPVLPSGTLLVTASLYAVEGGTSVLGLIAVAVLASIAGDVAFFLLGKHAGSWLFSKLGPQERRERIERMLSNHGGPLMVLARFVPAGRTLAALSASATGYPLLRYLGWSAIAAGAWGSYSVALGYLNGEWFGDSWAGLLIAIAAATGIGAVVGTLWRRGERVAAPVEPAVPALTA